MRKRTCSLLISLLIAALVWTNAIGADVSEDARAPIAILHDQGLDLGLVGNRAGSFAYYDIEYPGDGRIITIQLDMAPGDPAALPGLGFNVYGFNGYWIGEGTQALDKEDRKVLRWADHNPGPWLIQVYNYLDGVPVNFHLEVSGLPVPPPTPTSAPTITATSTRVHARRVLILSMDGARDDWVDGYLADGTMPNLAALAQRGARAEYAQTIDPSLTAAAHVSIATCAYPGTTGQVSNKFHLSKNPFYWYTSGFDEPEMQVDPLWRVAMDHGLTTATLFWPGTVIDKSERLADYTVAYGKREVYSALHVLTPTVASGWQDPPSSYSPLLEAELRITGRDDALVTKVHLLSADTTDDQQTNYDSIFLTLKKQVDADSVRLGVGEWAPFLVRPRLHGGGYFKVLNATPERVEVFQSALWYNQARPVELLRSINEGFGFFPPSPDYYALEHGWISAEDYWEMAEVQTRWMAEVESYVLTTHLPDLAFAWLGVTDECGHQFLMVEKRQTGYSEEKAQQYASYLRSAYALADEGVGELVDTLDLDQDAMFVLSDHGMAPIHSQVYVNTILQQAGLLHYGEGASFPIDTGRSKAVAFASGGAVNVYINLEGREQPGIVASEDYTRVEDEIVHALQSARSAQGEPLFARVLRREELTALHLDSEISGDVFAQATLGYALTDWRGNPNVVEPASYYGQHGYNSTLLEMHAILVMAGQGIRPGVLLPAVHLLDVVPTAASLLGLAPMETTEGRVLQEALR